jgi:hypothetical protein
MKLALMHQKRTSIQPAPASTIIGANNVASGSSGATVTQSTQTSSTPPVVDTTNISTKSVNTSVPAVSG